MSRRKFVKMLLDHGWSLDRSEGIHDVYRKSSESIAVPRHSDISPGIIREWHKKNERADREGAD